MPTTLLAIGDLEAFSAEWWWTLAITAGIAILVAILITLFSRHYLTRARRRAKDAGDSVEGRQARRRVTIIALITTTLQVLAWFVVLLVGLTVLGVDVGPLVASAGIIGVALGFGAQSLVKDVIAGMFIAAEAQFDVGDSVELQTDAGPILGSIEALTLRITSVREFDGTLSFVPNGTILVTSNKTRGWGRAIVDLRLALGEESNKVRDVLTDLFAEMLHEQPFESGLRDEPQLLGVIESTDTAQVFRVTAETYPTKRFEIERALRERILARLSERGIKLPPQLPAAPVDPGA